MSIQMPVRLGPAELALIEQLQAAGASAAAERFANSGLPTRRVEAYHYTDLKTLWRNVPPAATASEANAPALDLPGAFVVRVVNGRVQPLPAAPAHVHAHIVPESPLTMRDDVVVHLNAGLVRETVAIEIGGAAPVIVLDRSATGPAGHAASGARIFIADGVEATVVDVVSGEGGHATNQGSHVTVGAGARLTYVTLDLSKGAATTFATHEIVLGADANLRTLTFNAGSTLSRTNVFVTFGGQGAYADLTGLNLVDAGQHHDITLEAVHAVPHTSCKPLYKQVARGRSTAVFQGRLLVARDAQKTDSKLMTQGLMLSDEAEILSKPELEIYADDVVCGHGSTCGALDANSLFYLMSRGIPRVQAESMLIRAFVEEVIDPIGNEDLRAALSGVVERWMVAA